MLKIDQQLENALKCQLACEKPLENFLWLHGKQRILRHALTKEMPGAKMMLSFAPLICMLLLSCFLQGEGRAVETWRKAQSEPLQKILGVLDEYGLGGKQECSAETKAMTKELKQKDETIESLKSAYANVVSELDQVISAVQDLQKQLHLDMKNSKENFSGSSHQVSEAKNERSVLEKDKKTEAGKSPVPNSNVSRNDGKGSFPGDDRNHTKEAPRGDHKGEVNNTGHQHLDSQARKGRGDPKRDSHPDTSDSDRKRGNHTEETKAQNVSNPDDPDSLTKNNVEKEHNKKNNKHRAIDHQVEKNTGSNETENTTSHLAHQNQTGNRNKNDEFNHLQNKTNDTDDWSNTNEPVRDAVEDQANTTTGNMTDLDAADAPEEPEHSAHESSEDTKNKTAQTGREVRKLKKGNFYGE